MQIPPGQPALPPNPAPPIAPAPQAAHAEVIEPVRRVGASRKGAEAESKAKPRPGTPGLHRTGPRDGGRGQLLDLLV